MLRNTAKKKPAKKIGTATIEFAMDDDDMLDDMDDDALEMDDAELYDDDDETEYGDDEAYEDDELEDLSMYEGDEDAMEIDDDALYADDELELDENALYEDDAAELNAEEYYAEDDGEYEDEYDDMEAGDDADYELYADEDDGEEYADYDEDGEVYDDDGEYEDEDDDDDTEYADDGEEYDADEYADLAGAGAAEENDLIDLEMSSLVEKPAAPRKPGRVKQQPAVSEITFDDSDFDFSLEDLEPVPQTRRAVQASADEPGFAADGPDEIMELEAPVPPVKPAPRKVSRPAPPEPEEFAGDEGDELDDDFDFEFDDGDFELAEELADEAYADDEFADEIEEPAEELPPPRPKPAPAKVAPAPAKAPSIGRPAAPAAKEIAGGKPKVTLAEARPDAPPKPVEDIIEMAEPIVELVHEPEKPKDKMSEILRQAEINQKRINEVLSNTVTLAPQPAASKEPPPNVANRRQHARIQASILVDYVSADEDGDSSQGMGVVLDISISGLKLQTPRALAGSHITVYATDFNDNVMEIKGMVRQSYQKDNVWMNGISFESTENDTIKFITNLVRIFNSRKYMKSE